MGTTNVEWYHGKVPRDDAVNLLKNHGSGKGTFLVRESNSSPGDFVLSVLDESNEVIHYQIRKHGEDAFYSIDEENIIHGLDSLIEYYQKTDPTVDPHLTIPVPGLSPPPYSRRHGYTNLFHRATERSGYKVVREMLNCGYPSIDAKNQDGQTAAHIASRKGNDEILKELIENGANINCRDAAGCTPLHYACQSNLQSTVQLLIQEGGANIQMRNHDTYWVPLHEAASRGYCQVVQTLLALNAPARPRTAKDQTPEDLAMQNRHYECAKLLRNYKEPIPKTSRDLWYHGTLDRNEAKNLLENQVDGSFLVRYTNANGGSYVLTMMHKKPYHYIINRKDNSYYYIDQGPYFESLEHLVEYYSTFPDGLHTKLETPIKPHPKPPLPEFSTIPRIDRITFKGPQDELIPKEHLILGQLIGEGEFAHVYKGTYQAPNSKPIKVAIKTLIATNLETDKENFLREAGVMAKLKHHCIVAFIGLCKTETDSIAMVQEYVELGSMLNYIKTQTCGMFDFSIWAAQIACGMIYLETQQFVHRDLAARNILLASRHQAKISDFGLSRAIVSSNYYKALKGGKWPVRWYAPESYNFGTFSHASDVWSYGVMLWEMFTHGEQPFEHLKGVEVIDLIDKGERLAQPTDCPDDVYHIMQQCWQHDPSKRPKFQDLKELFSGEAGYMNVKELINNEIS